MDGPVVKAAMKALETGNVNLVLIWVQKKDEADLKKAFEKTLTVRKLSRIHRAGEGAPYTGLKPAGRDLGPAIPAVDKAVESGDADALLKLLTGTVQDNIRKHFKHLMEKKKYDKDDVDAGREFVATYVVFVHFAERIYESAKNPAHGHLEESQEADTQSEKH
jgi:hypothetical protein